MELTSIRLMMYKQKNTPRLICKVYMFCELVYNAFAGIQSLVLFYLVQNLCHNNYFLRPLYSAARRSTNLLMCFSPSGVCCQAARKERRRSLPSLLNWGI